MYITGKRTFRLSKSSGGFLGLEDAFRDARSISSGPNRSVVKTPEVNPKKV